jgi:hypothetical protein
MSILRADSIRDRAGTGAPNFPNGATVTGVITATSFSGAITGNVTGNVSGNVTGNADTATLATNAQGLTGTPNLLVGITTISTLIPTVSRFKSVAEEVKVGTGTSVTIDFDGGDGNIGFVASPSGPVTLYVNDIPTTGFSNKAITLTVAINQGATGYACSSVYFNGTEKTLRWASGTVSAGNTSCIDYYSFVGIDTVGDGAIASYTVTASANGDFRYY